MLLEGMVSTGLDRTMLGHILDHMRYTAMHPAVIDKYPASIVCIVVIH
jgi:hypothetical protein